MSLVQASVSKILIVDDGPEIVSFIRELVTSRGYEAMGLSQPREVPDQLVLFQPDLCIRFPHALLTGSDLPTQPKRDPSVEVITHRSG
jgi:CheY-like chemotaxis protein